MGTGLFADLYAFTMVQSYLEHGRTAEAVFDLHVRALPPQRGYLVAAGLASAARRLAAFRFDQDDLAFLARRGLSDALLDYLRRFRFAGEVRAVPEGRLVFPHEPLLQVRAPLPMGQLVETVVLNAVHAETVLASKAARCFHAARRAGGGHGPQLVDFGARRAHGPDAALAAARCSWLAGFDGTSLVEAARSLGLPCYGTMAHAYVLAFPREEEALAAFAASFPHGTTLLIDTFDTREGARRAARVAARLGAGGVTIGAVRLDSGDLATLAHEVRGILDAEGLRDVGIFASGGLDEDAIAHLLARGAPVDGLGVGTAMVVARDLPALDMAYKLCSYDAQPVLKTSPGKRTLPGAKQVWRDAGPDGALRGDTIAAEGEAAEGEPLLGPVGDPSEPAAVRAARARFLAEFPRLPEAHRHLARPHPYPVRVSERIEAEARAALARLGEA